MPLPPLTSRRVLYPALAALTAAVRLPSALRPVWNPDEGYLATQARQLAAGGRLYETVVDRKPPLVPWLYEAAFAVFGHGSLAPLRVAAALAVLAGALLTASLARRRWGVRAGGLAGTLYVLLSVGLSPEDTQAATFEVFMLPWTVAAMWCADRGRWALAGLAVAGAALSKQTGGAVLLPVLFLLLRRERRPPARPFSESSACERPGRGRWAGLGGPAVRLLAAAVLPVAAVASAFGPARFAYWTATGSGAYLSASGAVGHALLRASANAGVLALVCAPVLAALAVTRRRTAGTGSRGHRPAAPARARLAGGAGVSGARSAGSATRSALCGVRGRRGVGLPVPRSRDAGHGESGEQDQTDPVPSAPSRPVQPGIRCGEPTGLGGRPVRGRPRGGGEPSGCPLAPDPGAAPARHSTADVRLWLAVSAAAAAVGFQFFGHYFLQLLPPLALLGAAGLSVRGRRAVRAAVGGTAVLTAGFVVFALTAAPRAELDHARRLSAEVRARTAADDRVLVWGMHPEDYWLAGRRPASRYLTAGFLTNFSGGRGGARVGEQYAMPGAWPYFRRELARRRPELIVDDARGKPYRLARTPTLRRYVQRHYRRAATVDGAVLYTPVREKPPRPKPNRPREPRP